MSGKKISDTLIISDYKERTAARRAKGKPSQAKSGSDTKEPAGVITIRFSENAKPLSELGGVTKVLGPSRISIPEFKHPKDKSR